MNDILLIGSLSDPVLARIWDEYKSFDNAKLFTFEEFPHTNNVSVQWHNGQIERAYCKHLQGTSELEELAGIFYRIPTFSRLTTNNDNASAAESQTVHYNILYEWLHFVAQRVRTVASLSHESAITFSKPLQLKMITEENNLSVPSTIISNNADDLRAFCNAHGPAIQKSVSDNSALALEYIAEGPLVFESTNRLSLVQEIVNGTNIRVHIIGNTIIALEILSDSLDYRTDASINMKQIRLPSGISAACTRLATMFDLSLCGIDLIRSDNKWYFLEINAQPAFTEFDNPSITKLHLDALYAYLTGQKVPYSLPTSD